VSSLALCAGHRNGTEDKGIRKAVDEFEGQPGAKDGPANGHLFSSRAIDKSMLEVLEEPFASNQDLFLTKIESIQDLQKAYQVFRTLQRTSDTQALEMRVSKDDIDVVNRWAGVEKAQGRQPGREIRHYYTDITLLMKPFLQYTCAM
jgi:hypothetical protein